MPHIPRRQSPTTGVPQELMRPPGQHAPIPVSGPQPAQGKQDARPETPVTRRRRIGLGTISPHTYEPDNGQILRTLFGKEPNVDPHTGQLVLPQQPSPSTNAGPQHQTAHPVGVVLNGVAAAHDHGAAPRPPGPPLR